MYSSSALDKSSVGPDNCSSGRSNASNRFPVGITSLGDESQQIRIQLAVLKYNSSANGLPSNKCSIISPARHSLLKNSLKAKNFEREPESSSKTEKRNGNRYEGVGAFPTIHLKKSAIRYRPIRRFNDVKIPYPELPVNRFLSHLPEVCPDLKLSTRSVLDVLEDLSGNKIPSKEENGSNRPKLKGLGGDYLLNQDTMYRPLFVQKPKITTVLTRDNTTQTLSPLSTETQSPQSNNLFVINDASDPRAELRRKLAKQNNEIFASLSSSVPSSFALKRKIDKVLPAVDCENFSNGSSSKKSKISEYQPKNYIENGISVPINRSKTVSNDSIKLTKKNKFSDTNTSTSPNKDRLTTIYLDMQSPSLRVRMFQNSPASAKMKSIINDSQVLCNLNKDITPGINGFANKIVSPVINGSTGNTAENAEDVRGFKNSSCLNFIEKAESPGSKKQESKDLNNSVFNFPIDRANSTSNDALNSTSGPFQFNMNSSGTQNFSFPKGPIENDSNSNDISKNARNETHTEKTDINNQVLSKSFTSENLNDKSNCNSFKFGAEGNTSAALNISLENSKAQTSRAVLVSSTDVPNTVLQFSSEVPGSVAVSISQTSGVKLDIKNAQESTIPAKPLLVFEQNSLSQQVPPLINSKEQAKLSNGLSTVAVATTQSIHYGTCNFEQKSNENFSVKTTSAQNVSSTSCPTSQTNSVSCLPTAGNLETNSVIPGQGNKNVFTFGKKVETSATIGAPVTTAQDQKFAFTFEQGSNIGLKKEQKEFDQKKTNLIPPEQKCSTQESTQNNSEATNVLSLSKPATTKPSLIFGQNVSQASSTPQVTFNQSPAVQSTDNFGAKSEGVSPGNISTPVFSQNNSAFSIKTPLFEPSAGEFASITSQASTGFGTSTSRASGFGFGSSNTSQSSPIFATSSSSKTAPVFGTSTSQSTSGFGSSSSTYSAPVFGTSTSNSLPTFGIISTTQSVSTFGVSSTTQSSPSFGAISTTQSVSGFGTSSASQSTPGFGVPSTAPSAFEVSSTSQSTPTFGASSTIASTSAFGVSAGFGVSSSSQPSTAFGSSASTQSTIRFGAATSQPNDNFGVSAATSISGFGVSQSSFSQPFVSKPISSPGQALNIFGQNQVTNFTSNQSSVFGQKQSTEGGIFEQSKIQQATFGAAPQPFGPQIKFSFGMSTSSATGFTTSPPNTTPASVFNFGGNSAGSTFTFGSNTSVSSNSQTPFAFKSMTNEPFKFGAATPSTKEGSGFGGTSTATFSFGGQINSSSIAESKPAFNFGTQVSSSAPFNFGTPSPSVFSFGGSTSAGSGSGFNFGTPTPGGPFVQTSTAAPGTPFAVPGTFSIGSGSSQSRLRAMSRPRRRP